MRVSLAWLKEYIGLHAEISAQDIASKLTFAGFEVEGMHDQRRGLENVVVGQIIHLEKHPNADRLSFCHINVGAEKNLEIVCGAKNISKGDKVPVALVGAKLPNGMEIKASKIRGVASQGMLCSPQELCLQLPANEMVDGIYLLHKDAHLGQLFSEYMGYDDIILELNVLPNRGDVLSHLGVARELSALYRVPTKIPALLAHAGTSASTNISITNTVGEDCPIYFGRLIEGLKVGPSPAWLRKRIESIGLRSVNNIVDATSFVLFECGQPLHAFDADSLKQNNKIAITVRNAKENESFSTISHKEIKLSTHDVVIGYGTNAAGALAGVMGSSTTEVTTATKNIFLESAQFSPLRVRKTSRKFGLLSDAALRFERGIDPENVRWAMERVTDIILQIAGGKCSEMIASLESEKNSKKEKKSIRLREVEIKRCLGKAPNLEETMTILRNLGIQSERVAGEQDVLVAYVPSWRMDLHRPVDLIEEIIRIWGFEHLESKLALGGEGHAGFSKAYAQIRRLRRHLCSLGFFEVRNFGFTSKDEMASLGIHDAQNFVHVINALNQDFTLMRPNLAFGLLKNIAYNSANQAKNNRLFEVGKCFRAEEGGNSPIADIRLHTGVEEKLHLACVITGSNFDETWIQDPAKKNTCDFYTLKGVTESIFELLRFSNLQCKTNALPTYLHPGQAATIYLGAQCLGVIGRVHPRLEREIKAEQKIFLLELDLSLILAKELRTLRYKPYSRFPFVERDFSAAVPDAVTADTIKQFVLKAAQPLGQKLEFFDVYRGDRVPQGHTSYAFRLVLGAHDRTLTEPEINSVQEKVMSEMEKQLQARFAGK